jgi:hypothetical protein
VLDRRFLSGVQQHPWLAARVVERAATWAERGLFQQAINQVGRVELRLLFMLGHLAERWGRVTADGVYLPLRLTHESFGRLVGAQRPTVTLALKQLREQGAVVRRGDGWLIAPGVGDNLPLDTEVEGAYKTLTLARESETTPIMDGTVDGTLDDHLSRLRADSIATRQRSRDARAARAVLSGRIEHEDLEGSGRFEDDLAVVADDLPAEDLLDGTGRRS